MEKMLRRIALFCFIMAAGVSIVACSSDDDDENAGNAGGNASTTVDVNNLYGIWEVVYEEGRSYTGEIVNGYTPTDQFDCRPRLEFKSDGTYTSYFYNKSSQSWTMAGANAEGAGWWKLNGNTLQMEFVDYQAMTIKELTADKMVIYTVETDNDNPYSRTQTYKKINEGN